jgi:hypothetical protein
MFNAAIRGQGAPRHLSTDHDPLFEAHRWRANLRILEIDELKTVPHVPLSHPFVERLIGTMRREFLDHVPFWNARDVERKLADFQVYDDAARGHASLEGHTPLAFASGYTAVPADLTMCAGSPTTSSSSQSLPDDEFETDRLSARHHRLQFEQATRWLSDRADSAAIQLRIDAALSNHDGVVASSAPSGRTQLIGAWPHADRRFQSGRDYEGASTEPTHPDRHSR